jgi:tetratricopeptide (TPR) repeat protein
MVPRLAGVVVLALAVGLAESAVRDVDSLPGVAQWAPASASSPEPLRRQESRVSAMAQQGDDAAALQYVRSIAASQPALAAALHETLAGAYLKDRRLFWSTQHLDAIAAARRTDQARYLAAHIAARQRRLSDAAANLDALARRLPDDPLVARDQAQIAALLGRHEAAAAACERRLRLEPADSHASLLLARTRMQQGRASEAERLLVTLLARDPRNGHAAMQLGLLHLARREPANARDWFAKARSIEKQDAAPYLGEAAAALLLGQRPAARAAVAGARRLNPADPLAALLELLAVDGPLPSVVPGGPRFDAASLYVDLETEPLPAVIRAELESGDHVGRLAVANLLLEKWSAPAALAWLDAGSERGGQPGMTGPLHELTAVRALAAVDQWRAAGERLARLEKSTAARGLAGPALQAAAVAVRVNDPNAAHAGIDRAIAAAPESPRVRMLAGDLRLALGEPRMAIAEYRVALRGWPRDPRLLNQLAASLALVGTRAELEEALRFAETGLRQQPHYMLRATLLDTRADLLFRLGRSAEALAAYRELSTTVGGIVAPEPWHRLGDLAMAAADRPLARRAYEEALDYGREYPGRARAAELLMSVVDAPTDGPDREASRK